LVITNSVITNSRFCGPFEFVITRFYCTVHILLHHRKLPFRSLKKKAEISYDLSQLRFKAPGFNFHYAPLSTGKVYDQS